MLREGKDKRKKEGKRKELQKEQISLKAAVVRISPSTEKKIQPVIFLLASNQEKVNDDRHARMKKDDQSA